MRQLHSSAQKTPPLPSWLRATIAITLLMLLAMPGQPVSAHANLVSSDPPAGAALAQAPKQIVMDFSEDLDPSFSQIELVDGSSKVIIPGPGVVDTATHKRMTLQVSSLPDGVYSAVWKARSQVDGHVTFGAVGFSVGANTSRVSLLPPPGMPDPATATPQPLDSLTRWLGYIAAAVMLGSLLFGLLVWLPASRSVALDTGEANAYVRQLIRRLSLIGAAVLAVSTVAFAFVAAGQASGKPFAELFGPPIATYLATRSGVLLIVRLVLIAALAALVWLRLPPIGHGRNEIWWLAAALGTGVLVTFSLQSHAASADLAGAVILDTFHLLAMSAWMGGLLPLTLLPWAGRRQAVSLPPLADLIPRFSRVAMISVDVLAVTGLYSILTQVKTVEALVGTTYGQAVLAKTALVAVLIGLGAANLLILTPRLARTTGDAGRSLRITTGIELVIGLVVLLAAGILTSSEPAATALEAQQRLGFLGSADTDSVQLTLRVAPVQIGDNEFGVDFTDNRPGAAASPPQVLLRMGLKSGGLGLTQVEAAKTTGGRYTARGAYITLQGDWQIDVILRRAGYDDIVHRFYLTVGTGSAASALSSEDQTPNPIQPDSKSVAAGKTLYQTNCVPCHGVAGKGDGPVGLTLNPRPANLTVHTVPGVHTDGQLFKWISEGYPNSAMPPFAQYLSETERWNIVNFIRTLAQSPQ